MPTPASTKDNTANTVRAAKMKRRSETPLRYTLLQRPDAHRHLRVDLTQALPKRCRRQRRSVATHYECHASEAQESRRLPVADVERRISTRLDVPRSRLRTHADHVEPLARVGIHSRGQQEAPNGHVESVDLRVLRSDLQARAEGSRDQPLRQRCVTL
jgi:hypothetical protein